jgi:hypothetical protein
MLSLNVEALAYIGGCVRQGGVEDEFKDFVLSHSQEVLMGHFQSSEQVPGTRQV